MGIFASEEYTVESIYQLWSWSSGIVPDLHVCVCLEDSLLVLLGRLPIRRGTATEIISDDNDLTASCLDGNKLHSTVNSRR